MVSETPGSLPLFSGKGLGSHAQILFVSMLGFLLIASRFEAIIEILVHMACLLRSIKFSVKFRVISKLLDSCIDWIDDTIYIKKKQQGSQYGALRNTTNHLGPFRIISTLHDSLFPNP